jgi:hypothetical protein
MENEEADKITEELFRQNSHKTTKQTIELLESSKHFQKDISDLRKKWAGIIEKFNFHYNEATRIAEEKAFSKIKLPEKIEPKDAQRWVKELVYIKKNLPEKEQKEIAIPQKKALLSLANRDFTSDIIELCKKYKQLSPIELWLPQIRTYIVMGRLFPPDFFLTAGLKDYFTKEEIINTPQDLNFIPRIEKNPATGEKKLVVEFLDNTTIKQDLKKHGWILEKIKKLLRKEKGVKRFYPVKKIEETKKMAELEQKTDTYYEPLSGKQITKKLTYVDKALRIDKNIPLNKKEEQKAGNRLKQLEHRNKNRFL